MCRYEIIIVKALLLLHLTLFSTSLHAQNNVLNVTDVESRWVDSVYQSLTIEERIAQLLVVRANQPNQPYDSRIEDYIRHYNIGGVTFFRGKPGEQLVQTNRWQQLSKTPLLISIDAEWGLAMRLEGTVSYPLQMTLGAIENNRLIGLMGQQIAEQCKRMGIHMNFAPVVDINNNPKNPVIGMRSFGEDPELVLQKGWAYANALQQKGIIATAKHFPGHGDTYQDSHLTLPEITHKKRHLEKNELYPFQSLIELGVGGMMIAHLYMPAYEKEKGLAVSLSENVVTKLLKDEMGFAGLVVTDALDMKGVTDYHPAGLIELKALAAGNDILLLPENVPLAISTIRAAIEEGSLDMSRIEESCRKVLRWKFRVGLNQYRPAFPENLMADLNRPEYRRLVETLFEESMTLLKNENQIIPLKREDTISIASLSIGYDRITDFQKALSSYGLATTDLFLPRNPSPEQFQVIEDQLNDFDLIILSLQNTNILANRKFGISEEVIQFVNKIIPNHDVILSLFASPYALDFFDSSNDFKSILVAYQDRAESERAAAGIIAGKLAARGKLPVTASGSFKLGSGLITTIEPQQEETHLIINEKVIEQIDSLILDGINRKAYPGCQVIASQNGKVFYHKTFGRHTYEGDRIVNADDVYDLASLTKVLASTLAIMKLYDDGLLQLGDRLGKYFPFLQGTDKANISLIDILTHQSGFDGWIPFFMETLTENGPDTTIYAKEMSATHPYRVADSMYIHRDYKYVIYSAIAESELKKKEYRYSDMGFYFIPQLVEMITNQPFEVYLAENFYQPLGLGRMLFQPLNQLDRDEIVPTEYDRIFRHQLLHGDVHDQGAAMLGGISGHAGLFSNAAEVAVIMQMLLNEGTMYGHQYFKPETVRYFTAAHFTERENRRGIGFDKPPLNKPRFRTPAEASSPQSFGHTGFTGTFAWADPANQLIVVFISNRVYPESDNNAISRLNIRTNIHELFYQAVSASELSDEARLKRLME